MPTLALFGLLWAGAWLLVLIAGATSPETAFLVLVVVMVVFAIGQCLHGAVAGPLAADLAEPRLMGRYMALNAPVADRFPRSASRSAAQAGRSRRMASGSRQPRLHARRRLHARSRGRAPISALPHTDTGRRLG